MESISTSKISNAFAIHVTLSSSSSDPKCLLRPSRLAFHPRPPHRAFAPPRSTSAAAMALQRSDHDVVIVGAGIIGLTIARQLLHSSNLSVAVVDAAVPCSGATGAGQGYLWMAHKTPGSETWELATRSKQLWEEFANSISDQGIDPEEVIGWKKTGSLLVGRNLDELGILEERVRLLNQAGIRADFLSASSLHTKEPALELGKQGGAAYLPDDCQLDAVQTVAFIEKDNRRYIPLGRYAEFYNNPAASLIRSERTQMVEAVQTSKTFLHAKKAVVIAAGAWTGPLMQSLIVKPNILPDIPVKPRKGYLLVLENFKMIKLNHGLMEVGYANQNIGASTELSSDSGTAEYEQNMSSISMTATRDSKGNFVLGSSRQFIGFSKEIDDCIIRRIWERAAEFFPSLKAFSLDDHMEKKIKIGHRPYMPDGKPVIGPVPSLRNVFLAAGHEGSGLSMALGTAEMIADMILGNSGKVDYAPYNVQGRFC